MFEGTSISRRQNLYSDSWRPSSLIERLFEIKIYKIFNRDNRSIRNWRNPCSWDLWILKKRGLSLLKRPFYLFVSLPVTECKCKRLQVQLDDITRVPLDGVKSKVVFNVVPTPIYERSTVCATDPVERDFVFSHLVFQLRRLYLILF